MMLKLSIFEFELNLFMVNKNCELFYLRALKFEFVDNDGDDDVENNLFI